MAETSTKPGGTTGSHEPKTDEEKTFGTDVERVGSGYAPLKDDGNPKPREVREVEAREALGGEVLKDPHLPPIPTEAELAASVERSRTAPFEAPVERKVVIVNGVAMLVGEGDVRRTPISPRKPSSCSSKRPTRCGPPRSGASPVAHLRLCVGRGDQGRCG